MSPSLQKGTVVLVHGAWADGSSWGEVILPLEQQGSRLLPHRFL
jgi:hypothetical protein